MNITVSWYVVASSLKNMYQRIIGQCCLNLKGFATLKMEAVGSSEISIYQPDYMA
jgi:hypothetical protein